MYLSAWADLSKALTPATAPRSSGFVSSPLFQRWKGRSPAPATTGSKLFPTIDRIRATTALRPPAAAPINVRAVEPTGGVFAPPPPGTIPPVQTVTLAPLPQGGGDTMIAPDDTAAPTEAGAGGLLSSPVALGLLALGVILTLSRKGK